MKNTEKYFHVVLFDSLSIFFPILKFDSLGRKVTFISVCLLTKFRISSLGFIDKLF